MYYENYNFSQGILYNTRVIMTSLAKRDVINSSKQLIIKLLIC